jgi:diphthamide synthase (EF-2-diphthine--ammonia ligase)
MALTDHEKNEIRRISKEEMKDFLETTQAHKTVIKIIQSELDSKKMDEKIVNLATKVVVELFKTLWQRKSFWESAIQNVK